MKIQSQLRFECRCGNRFETDGTLEQWTSSIYGPCQEYRAACPSCGNSAKEYRPPRDSHDASEIPNGCGSAPCGQGPCGSGSCAL